ncbi:hypothetical protein SAMN02745124_01795 [Desulfofustis glycolicus DSM 9705]|uniref:Uncharacterized protein n=1 Tax=Desulfofustis glycolicus DSM 9705 TaxID=1121409 RepID=A0A1M5VPM7_9BACT|nr:hypothetical protein SAMN02745124_01795 [Desulfofustis glycolicus DSM 9705]
MEELHLELLKLLSKNQVSDEQKYCSVLRKDSGVNGLLVIT